MKNNNLTVAPVIGITASLAPIEFGHFMGQERAVVARGYVQAINQTGGIPLLLPVIRKEDIRRQLDAVDALLLSGGNDVSPLIYQEEPKKGLEATCLEQDEFEIALVEIARQMQKPIFGICRGLQLLNVALGGTLYHDIGLSLPNTLQHFQKAKPAEATHTVIMTPQTYLQQTMGSKTLLTNSFHHQSIKDLAPGLIVNACTEDGIIEGIEGTVDSFILGVQWHPELMFDQHPSMFKLFRAFVEAAEKRSLDERR